MIKITVKTLDSQNYQFEAESDWTVSRFKEHIQETVNISPNEQRLIFCGRVLQNDKKLSEYDCNEKVVHLVRRPPPPITSPTSADSNNNDGNFTRDQASNRHYDDGNVLFSTMTLAPDGNINHILRHIMTLQQALYSRTFDPIMIDPNIDPAIEMDRRLNNAARLLRITINLIAECVSKIPSSSSNAERSSQSSTRNVVTTASSHTDLPRNNELFDIATERSIDDLRIGSPMNDPQQTQRRFVRQSLTTDDLPQSSSRSPTSPIVSRAEGRPSVSDRHDIHLERYLNILDCASDVQSQAQTLFRRYRELINVSRRGGLITPNERLTSSEQNTRDANSSQISSALINETRTLSLYVPRILHHISHLQHSLSDFMVDASRGRLQVNPGQSISRPQASMEPNRSDRSSETTRSTNQTNSQATNSNLGEHTLEGSLTITATTVETTPIITTSNSTMHPQASATIVLSSEPSVQIPITIPLTVNSNETFNMGIPIISPQLTHSQRGEQNSERSQRQQEQEPRHQEQPRQQQREQSTSSNSTQTNSRSLGTSRVSLPFDYYLTCFSPYANYSVSTRSPPRPAIVPSARIQFRAAGPQEPPNTNARPVQTARPSIPSRALAEATPILDPGLTEVVTNIVGSIFRPSNQREQVSQGTSTQTTSPSSQDQDPLLNFMPAINAASQILGSVLGMSAVVSDRSSGQQVDQRIQQQNRQTTSSGTTLMDIDIDDNSSINSELRYQDASETNPVASSSADHLLSMPSSSRQNFASRPSRASSSSYLSSIRYDRNQLMEVMRNHPDWVPIIEADINYMEQHNFSQSNNPIRFSDAYLSSIPRKRRRLLTATPDRILILQPSSSEAIANLLRRAISNANATSANTLSQILNTISNNQEVQSAYEDYIRSAVETRLRDDYDYSPNKFVYISRYFK